MRKFILLTDMKDVAVSEAILRSVPNSVNDVAIIPVQVDTFDILHGAFLLRLLADSFESNDVVSIVCDPRFSDVPRESIGIELKNGVVVFGPNNGVMSWMLQDFELNKAIILPISEESKLHPTFNGKYRFAVAVNKCLSGSTFDSIGDEFDKTSIYMSKIADGTVVHIDNYGNVKIKLPLLQFERGSNVSIKLRDKVYTMKYGYDFFDVSEGEPLLYTGSSLWGLPELAINRGNFAKMYGVKVGDIVTIIGNNIK